MLLLDEQRLLIEKFVKNDKNFFGNEDLLEDFCSEAFEKSYMIFNSSSNITKIENYVNKVVHTSILSVLKNSGRVRRTQEGFIPTKEVVASEITPAVKQTDESAKTVLIGPEFFMDFPDPKESVEQVLITKDWLQRIVDAVCVIHKEKPSECYLNIFYLRYVKNLKQREIAERLELSQAEVSKRLMELSRLISNFLDKSKR